MYSGVFPVGEIKKNEDLDQGTRIKSKKYTEWSQRKYVQDKNLNSMSLGSHTCSTLTERMTQFFLSFNNNEMTLYSRKFCLCVGACVALEPLLPDGWDIPGSRKCELDVAVQREIKLTMHDHDGGRATLLLILTLSYHSEKNPWIVCLSFRQKKYVQTNL